MFHILLFYINEDNYPVSTLGQRHTLQHTVDLLSDISYLDVRRGRSTFLLRVGFKGGTGAG